MSGGMGRDARLVDAVECHGCGEPLTVSIFEDGSSRVSVGECPMWRTAELTPMDTRGLWLLLSRAVGRFTGGDEARGMVGSSRTPDAKDASGC